MPVYEFRCGGCGAHYEIACRWEDRQKKAVCPKCGSKKAEPLITSFACEPPKRY